MENRKAIYRVVYEYDSGAFLGVLVLANSEGEARALGEPQVEYGDEEDDLKVQRQDCYLPGESRVLSMSRDAEVYRNLGWAEDGDEDGPSGCSCEVCGLHGFEALPSSLVCSWCGRCGGCGADDEPIEEGPCPSCALPVAPNTESKGRLLDKVVDFCAEGIQDMTDEEVSDELRSQGVDPEDLGERMLSRLRARLAQLPVTTDG